MSEQDDLDRYKYLKLKQKQQGGNDLYLQIGGDQSNAAPAADNRSLGRKAWDALGVPEQKSREGLTMLTDALTPSMQDIEAGKASVPGIAGRAIGETLAQEAPKFISRGAILTAGALKGAQAAAPWLKMAAKGIGSELESASGTAPKAAGALNKAYNDATLIFAKGKEAAKPLYQAAEEAMPEGTSVFNPRIYKPDKIVDRAIEVLDSGGKLEPTEALTARQAVDELLKSKGNLKGPLLKLRDELDIIAKGSPDIAEADPMHARGVAAAALRKILPQNATGGTSAGKTAILKYTGGLAAPLFVPIAQGAAATGAGLVGRYAAAPLANNPVTGLMAPSIVDAIKSMMSKRKGKQ